MYVREQIIPLCAANTTDYTSLKSMGDTSCASHADIILRMQEKP